MKTKVSPDFLKALTELDKEIAKLRELVNSLKIEGKIAKS